MSSPAASARATPARRSTAASGTTSPSPATRTISTSTSASPSPGLRRASSLRGGAPRLSTGATASARRAAPPLKSPTRANGVHPEEIVSTDVNETLLLSLRRETEEKEELLVKLQNKDQLIENLRNEADNMNSAISAAETRLAELYADQDRMDAEMHSRLELIEKLRIQVREMEKEKRDNQRRYTEQAQTFDAERQSFYDNEQHLKSRIQSLTQSRKAGAVAHSPVQEEPPVEGDDEQQEQPADQPPVIAEASSNTDDEASEPAEMTSLRLELSTLSVSHSSLQNTMQLLQTELFELKRVNNELQEENESYNMLLRERTLTGQFDPMRYAGSAPTSTAEDEEEADNRSLRSAGRSALGSVSEADELALELQGDRVDDDLHHLSVSRSASTRPRKGRGSSPPPKGESLGDLPISGPGLDLASELGRAENKDMLDGRTTLDEKRGKKANGEASSGDVETLRNEIKALKDANKALSLYASKILDRIISEEGFEHVLAVDYDKGPGSPTKLQTPRPNAKSSTPQKPAKARPQSLFFGGGAPAPKVPEPPATPQPPQIAASAVTEAKRNRRSLSFDWRSFSLFGADKAGPSETPPAANLRPLALRPGAASVVGARKLETTEDDDDRRERERLQATMKLMGIDAPPPSAAANAAVRSVPEPRGTPPPGAGTQATARWSLFGSKSSAPSTEQQLEPGENLTHEALEHAEAQQTLAALDAREKEISLELAKGGSSGFTEMKPRSSLGDEWRSRRSKRSAGGNSGSGSTVWSAGLGKDDDSVQRMLDERADESRDLVDS